jgi:S-adenosylmethionine:diacylglycerol 3-amino-3-carboxypropyl transferase
MDRAGRASADYPLQNLPLAAGQAVSEHEQLADMAGRVDVQSGDFFESVPGADVYVLSYILHDWDDESCLRILRAIRNAAAPGARLVIIESVIPSPSPSPSPFSFIETTLRQA